MNNQWNLNLYYPPPVPAANYNVYQNLPPPQYYAPPFSTPPPNFNLPPPNFLPNTEPPPNFLPNTEPPPNFLPNTEPPPNFLPNTEPPPNFLPNTQPPQYNFPPPTLNPSYIAPLPYYPTTNPSSSVNNSDSNNRTFKEEFDDGHAKTSSRNISQEKGNRSTSSRFRRESPPRRSPNYRSRSSSRSSRYREDKYRDRNRSKSRSRYRSKSPSHKSRSRSRNHSPKIVYSKNESSLTDERKQILQKWRKNYCSTKEEVTTKLEELNSFNQDEAIENEKNIWTRSTPADLYYERDEINPKVIRSSPKLKQLCDRFNEELVLRAKKINMMKPPYQPPPRKNRARICKHKTEVSSGSSCSDEDLTDEEDCTMEELQRKQKHPDCLHPEMWYNDPGEMNDGPLCRCSNKSRKSGIRHGIYPGETLLKLCDLESNNADKLYHYKITISPPTNFLIKTPTIIHFDEHEFIFEGFSMLSHSPLEKLPTCKVIRFNIEYTILYIEEKIPDNFTVRELNLFYDYLFKEILELIDLDVGVPDFREGCTQFHFMPRFVRELPDNGKEILAMKEVLNYLLYSSVPLIGKQDLEKMVKMSQYEWQAYADEIKGMVVTYPGKKPCSVRVDQLDRNIDLQKKDDYMFPEIVHFGIRPPQLSYAGNPEYQKAWRDYVKFRHLLANMSKPTFEDKRKLEAKENRLQEMRTQGKMKRDVTVAISAEGFYRTGIMCDIIQHAMLLPVLVCHLRFHNSLNVLESSIGYKFSNRALLQLALTHPSYRENFGTNPDHARNSLTNCGIRQPEYGDRRIHYMNTRKRGINTLINIMSRFGKQQETESNITHNERLEFLGDAVVEFLSSIHLFFTFPELEEGGLATYRAAIVQNQHLAVLAKTLKLDQFMLYAHGSDLCHDLELRHAMANCFEAVMGALFLDGGIGVADKVFSDTLFKDSDLLDVWVSLPSHPLQEQEPEGDREWIPKFELLQTLTKFEDSIGVEFNHIRLLARAFTDRSVGYTNLTMGSNQRLEFLGDTVLQLIASEYLYKFFPEHHEGHLSLLRSSLVNNRTQAVVCDDLGMASYAVYNNPKAELKTKDRADLLEAFIGALYVDQGLEHCETFCQVTLFPRLQDFIMNQDWNDPKSKLQQCCLTLRTMDGSEPDIPVYKVIECKGPTNTRVYTVAVYFRGKRLAHAVGHSIQQAEMNAAKKALKISENLFPQLDHQKRVIAKSLKKQKTKKRRSRSRSVKSPEQYSRKRCRSRSISSDRAQSKSPRLRNKYREKESPTESKSYIKKEKCKVSKYSDDSSSDESPARSKSYIKKEKCEVSKSSDDSSSDESPTRAKSYIKKEKCEVSKSSDDSSSDESPTPSKSYIKKEKCEVSKSSDDSSSDESPTRSKSYIKKEKCEVRKPSDDSSSDESPTRSKSYIKKEKCEVSKSSEDSSSDEKSSETSSASDDSDYRKFSKKLNEHRKKIEASSSSSSDSDSSVSSTSKSNSSGEISTHSNHNQNLDSQ
ncbi:ribonuclease 3 [Harmonia axyridis]|uniref:ribonuclease 3 n=1 Tax=Harmonia axyridis TaxID=115357 RepID=UPI001E278A45|nr:ribonuclease 3 [Harmonia axyridis]